MNRKQARQRAIRDATRDCDASCEHDRPLERVACIRDQAADYLAEWESYTDPESIYGLDVGLHDYR